MTKITQSKSMIAIRKNLDVIIARKLVTLRLSVGKLSGILSHLHIRIHMRIMIAKMLAMIM